MNSIYYEKYILNLCYLLPLHLHILNVFYSLFFPPPNRRRTQPDDPDAARNQTEGDRSVLLGGTDDGGPTGDLPLDRRPEAEAKLECRLADTSAVLPDAQVLRVFAVFAHSSLSPSY